MTEKNSGKSGFMQLLLQRMIQRFHEEIFQRMSPEARARKLTIMRTLAKTMRAKKKENENPLNNNTALPMAINFIQSTPLRVPQITDLDDVESDSASETPLEEIFETDYIIEENSLNEESRRDESENPQLVINKMYDTMANFESINSEIENKLKDSDDTLITEFEDKNKHWKSLEVLHENAEYEFCRSLEESKLHVSSSSLLEEIEADLPSPYSLTKPFNYTFHTVSSYRTQTRLARMVRFGLPSKDKKDLNSTCPNFLKEDWSKSSSPPGRLKHLEMEAKVQKILADQAEKALNLSKTQKFLSVQHLESEKAFLLANLRHQAAIQEMKKIKLSEENSIQEIFGQVTISDIFFQMDTSAENYKEQYLCVVMEKEKVQSSLVVSDEMNGKIHFNEEFKFYKLKKNFVIVLELYKLHFKEPKNTILKTALVKKLRRMTPVNTNRSITYSFYGKSSFVRVMSAELRLDHITRRENNKCVLLNHLPEHLTGTSVTIQVKTDIKPNIKLDGFLNVFRQTWHRRWYSLSGYNLESWLYPEDCDSGKSPVDSIYLPDCTSALPVGIEVCIRPHCFALNLRSPEERILFSADSNTSMEQWVTNLNLIIENILAWRPNI